MDADRVTSQPRLSSCQRRLASADSVEDVLSLQSSHDHENTGICNHSLYQTVYSYLLHFNHGAMSLAVKKGRPCDLGVYNNLDLPLGLKWTPDAKDMFCAEYPQASIWNSISVPWLSVGAGGAENASFRQLYYINQLVYLARVDVQALSHRRHVKPAWHRWRVHILWH